MQVFGDHASHELVLHLQTSVVHHLRRVISCHCFVPICVLELIIEVSNVAVALRAGETLHGATQFLNSKVLLVTGLMVLLNLHFDFSLGHGTDATLLMILPIDGDRVLSRPFHRLWSHK